MNPDRHEYQSVQNLRQGQSLNPSQPDDLKNMPSIGVNFYFSWSSRCWGQFLFRNKLLLFFRNNSSLLFVIKLFVVGRGSVFLEIPRWEHRTPLQWCLHYSIWMMFGWRAIRFKSSVNGWPIPSIFSNVIFRLPTTHFTKPVFWSVTPHIFWHFLR